MNTKNMTPIEYYTYTYPQLTLPVKEGESTSEEYINITRKCMLPDICHFPLKETGQEERIELDTPAGRAEALYLPDREIFERFMQVLGNKCEPQVIPRTTGAVLISGINNIRKYLSHDENYKDTVLLISRGYYSNISPEMVSLEADEWIAKSKIIRIYHEFTHFVSRRMYIEHKEAVRDEVLADMIGILAAFGTYDGEFAKLIIGIENNAIREDARLINYVEAAELEEKAAYARGLIDRLVIFAKENYDSEDPFKLLLAVEDEYIR